MLNNVGRCPARREESAVFVLSLCERQNENKEKYGCLTPHIGAPRTSCYLNCRPKSTLSPVCHRLGTLTILRGLVMSILLEQLTKRYEGYPVVNNVSLEIADGEFFVLLGPSGSGKSTILRMIAGLISIDAGRVVLRGRDPTSQPPPHRGT